MADYKDPENTILIELKDGTVVIELLPDVAPQHSARMKELARAGHYDGVVFHRVIDGFMAQTGDVKHGKVGGDLGMARRHFLRARDIGQGRFLMTEVYFAQYYARKTFDRDLFVRTLRHVLEQPVDTVPELTLLNTVAHRKAAEMLAAVDEYF